jgi:hypothetical protein
VHPRAVGGADQVEDVGAGQRVAAGDHEDPHAHPGGLLDEIEALLGAELVGMTAQLGVGPAVRAPQRARRVTSQASVSGAAAKSAVGSAMLLIISS